MPLALRHLTLLWSLTPTKRSLDIHSTHPVTSRFVARADWQFTEVLISFFVRVKREEYMEELVRYFSLWREAKIIGLGIAYHELTQTEWTKNVFLSYFKLLVFLQFLMPKCDAVIESINCVFMLKLTSCHCVSGLAMVRFVCI